MKLLIKIGGTLLDDATHRRAIAGQLAAAARTHAVSVVHGGGKQMTRFLEERNVRSAFVRGLRVTTPEVADAVLKVFAGSVNTQLVASLNSVGVRAVGLTGLDSGLAVAEQLDPELGMVGRVISSDPGLLNLLTANQYVPVVACVAGGSAGEVYNVNGDSMAVAVAAGWAADCLIFLTDVPGVLDAAQDLIPRLTVAECQALITSGVATGGMQAKLNAACDGVSSGVGEVRIVRGSDPEIIARVLAGESIGTAIGPGSGGSSI